MDAVKTRLHHKTGGKVPQLERNYAFLSFFISVSLIQVNYYLIQCLATRDKKENGKRVEEGKKIEIKRKAKKNGKLCNASFSAIRFLLDLIRHEIYFYSSSPFHDLLEESRGNHPQSIL